MDQSKGPQTKAKILIVDDQESIRRLLLDVLGTSGQALELLQASDGVEARDILHRTAIDIVVTDLLMPRMGGLELMQWAQQQHLDITWIILSGQGTFNDAVKAIQLGAFDFITKPQDLVNSVRVTVRNALRQRALAAEREKLTSDLATGNALLTAKVAQLEEACRLLYEQADTIEQDLRRAELIQRALLPRSVPAMDGVSVAAVYRPSHNVGGDLYDVVRLDDRHVVLYIADAAGHGVAAAMLTVLFKHRLALVDEDRRPRQPADVLAGVNEALRSECHAPGLFVTAAYGLLDLDKREMTIASAGHPPLLLRRDGGQIEMIYHTGPALGLKPQATFAQKQVTLQPNDRLLLYTDGLYETATGEMDYWELARMLKATTGGGASLLHRLLEEFASRRGAQGQEDDITLVMLAAAPAQSTLDNVPPPAAVLAASCPTAAPVTAQGEVLIGRDDDRTFLSIRGSGTWAYCAQFHDACQAEIKHHRPLRLDLSLCIHLDSTFLGTIQEVAAQAGRTHDAVEIQGVLPHVRRLFEELGMDAVLASLREDVLALPGQMSPLTATGPEDTHRHRILHAHETLASLNDHNRKEFLRLIEGLRQEMQRAEAGR